MNTLQHRAVPTDAETIDRPDLNAVVYLYINREGRPSAVGFSGRRTKADFRYHFRSPADRDRHVNDYFDNLAKILAFKEERRKATEAARAKGHGFTVGTILEYTWGYEQTNWDFFEVIGTSKGSVWIREIATKTVDDPDRGGWMTHDLLPLPGAFTSEPGRKRVQFTTNGQPYLSMPHGNASRWDGKSKTATFYA